MDEGQLHQARRLLSPQDCQALSDWWLAVLSHDSQTPNWDIASTCTVDGRKGVLLVVAKAHNQELKAEDRVGGSRPNRERIAECLREANYGLADWTEFGWALSHEHRYQMANRFAWSWKVAELGYRIILVYLGFLRAEEMRKGREQYPFNSHSEWESLVKAHSQPLFPCRVWGHRCVIRGHPFVPRICSIETSYNAPIEED